MESKVRCQHVKVATTARKMSITHSKYFYVMTILKLICAFWIEPYQQNLMKLANRQTGTQQKGLYYSQYKPQTCASNTAANQISTYRVQYRHY